MLGEFSVESDALLHRASRAYNKLLRARGSVTRDVVASASVSVAAMPRTGR